MTTTHIVTDHKYAPLFKPWCEERLKTAFDEHARFIGNVLINEDGTFEILFCVVLSNWTTNAIEAAAVSNGSKRMKISRNFMYTMYDYVFRHAGKGCLYSLVSVDNIKSLKLQKSAGFIQTGALPNFYGDGIDAHIFSITKQQWLDGKWSSWNSEGDTHG